ncbi:MAG: TfoX/Sxy family protein [Paludibacteraceae bacterium]|nr:TfoX/Sxy family protein [Paludibacteraceae bacterium]
MSCSIDYIEYVCSQLSSVGEVRSRKMMGDYLIYIDEKPVIIACDNLCYVKKVPEIESLMVEAECGFPYPGAKEHYILDIDHKKEAMMVVKILRDVLPYPKQRKKK